MTIRALRSITGFTAWTLALTPAQMLILKLLPKYDNHLPVWYHRGICKIFGIDVKVHGKLINQPSLLISNHISWLDIPVLSTLGPMSFVAKKEIGTWPIISQLASLQKTVFVERGNRAKASETVREMMLRLEQGNSILLFPEGTTTDGNRVLPFKTTLFSSAKETNAIIQPISLAYTHLHGIALDRYQRKLIGYYGDISLKNNAWYCLSAGPITAQIIVGDPIDPANFETYKDLARYTETKVREGLIKLLRGN